MTTLQLISLAGKICQVAFGVYVAIHGLNMMSDVYDHRDPNYGFGKILAAIGAVIILIAMRGL